MDDLDQPTPRRGVRVGQASGRTGDVEANFRRIRARADGRRRRLRRHRPGVPAHAVLVPGLAYFVGADLERRGRQGRRCVRAAGGYRPEDDLGLSDRSVHRSEAEQRAVRAAQVHRKEPQSAELSLGEIPDEQGIRDRG